MLCRHCGRSPINRPRGLCWRCYYTPQVRRLYPRRSFLPKAMRERSSRYPLPPYPTRARPGTEEKINVLRQRVRQRWQLWHPRDAPLDDET
jgi:ribosomal protein L37E